MIEIIGWISSFILLLTLMRQVYTQWRTRATTGVSKWLFVGQLAASTGYICYSYLLHNWVYVSSNIAILATAFVGEAIYLRNRRRPSAAADNAAHSASAAGVSVETTGATPPTDVECAIIGAGPAGLTAALYLARFRRQVIVIDAQQSRAELIPESHNYPGFPQGVSGVDLLSRLRAQAKQYGVPIIHDEVKSLQQTADKFLLVSAKGSIRAATVLLATGVNDRQPEMGDVRAATLAGAVRWCPICDGYEVQGKAVALLSPVREGFKHALFPRTYTANLTWFVEGDMPLRPEQETELSSLHVRCVVDSVSHIKVLPGPRVSVTTIAGTTRVFDTLYPMIGCKPRVDLLQGLNARQDQYKQLWVDEHQQTSIPGIYAAGDVVHALNQMSVGAAHAATAATAIHNALPKNYAEPLGCTDLSQSANL